MSESKFSPAPWKVSLVDETAVIDASGNQVAQASGDYDAADEWPAMAANARLIATSPDLLAALKAVTSADCVHGAFDLARAAIAKAEGRPC